MKIMSFSWKDEPFVEFDSNICRLCAEISVSLLPIFQVDGASKNRIDIKIKKCFPSLLIDQHDSKPKQICMSCLSKLDICNDLFDLCFAAESKFNTILNGQCSIEENKETVVETCVIKQTSADCLWTTDDSKSDKTLTVHDGGVIVLSKMGTDILDVQHQANDNRDFVVMVELKYKEPDPVTDSRSVSEKSDSDMGSFNIQDKLQSLVAYTEEACTVHIEKDKNCDNSYLKNEIKDNNDDISSSPLILFDSQKSIEPTKDKCLRLITNTSDSVKKNAFDKINDQFRERSNGKTPNGKKLFVCSICGKHFQRRTRLNSHMAIHSEIRPHSCDQCNESFVMRWDLTLHQRIHSRVFECEYCKKLFTVRSKLDRHLRTHTGERPHVCGYCCKSFSDKRNLDNHLRTHTGEKPYICNICNRGFRVRTHLTDHQRVHTKEMPFRCNMCGKTFRWKANFNMHMKMHSPGK